MTAVTAAHTENAKEKLRDEPVGAVDEQPGEEPNSALPATAPLETDSRAPNGSPPGPLAGSPAVRQKPPPRCQLWTPRPRGGQAEA